MELKLYLNIFLLLILNKSYSQKDLLVDNIQKEYKMWQPIINSQISGSEQLYNYAWGENFEFNQWFTEKMENDTLTLSQKISIMEQKDLGTSLFAEEFSYSGDWLHFFRILL